MATSPESRLVADSYSRHLALPSALALALSGCTVGPDYHPPVMYVGEFAQLEPDRDVMPNAADPEFWRTFGDPQLTRLVEAALRNNRDLHQALANYQASRALLRQVRTDLLPAPTGSGSLIDEQSGADGAGLRGQAGNGASGELNVGATWELDFFGRIRRGVEAQQAEVEASAADLAVMQVAVVGELARTYFEMRSLQEQLRLAQSSAENQAETQRVLQLRFEAGAGTRFDIDRGRSQLEATRARIPGLEARIGVAVHRIAVLTGVTPASLVGALQPADALPGAMTAMPPVDAPGELLRRRPDVAAAEHRLAAATARIGVVTADLFPRFTLSGLVGMSSIPLFQTDSATRLISLGADGGFLNVGRVRARIAEAEANTAGALAAYERAVLTALEDTENALIRLSRGRRELEHLRQASEAASGAVRLARARFAAGDIDMLEVLDAERMSLQADDGLAQARLRLANAHLALFLATTGGWSAPNVIS